MLVLLDRDGVLNEDRPDYVKNPGELVMIPGAAEAVARLNGAGIRVAVVTNQACVGKGIIDLTMLDRIHQHLRGNLARAGARLDEIFFCPDPPWAATDNRKPGPGMLRQALAQFKTEPAVAVMIGDTLRDMEAALTVGCRRILVRTGKGRNTQAEGLPHRILPVAVHDDLAAAVDSLLAERT
jgi:D-glycero-D-manno-heptose 1,7-bisphosphate phosphatase